MASTLRGRLFALLCVALGGFGCVPWSKPPEEERPVPPPASAPASRPPAKYCELGAQRCLGGDLDRIERCTLNSRGDQTWTRDSCGAESICVQDQCVSLATCELPCPPGTTCGQQGQCLPSGPPIEVNLATTELTGTVFVNGAPVPPPEQCQTYEWAAFGISLEGETTKARSYVVAHCRDGYSFRKRVLKDRYRVRIGDAGVIEHVSNQNAYPRWMAPQLLDVRQDTEVTWDVRRTRVRGTLLRDGQAPVADCLNAAYEKPVVFTRPDTGEYLGMPLHCDADRVWFEGELYPGTWDVEVWLPGDPPELGWNRLFGPAHRDGFVLARNVEVGDAPVDLSLEARIATAAGKISFTSARTGVCGALHFSSLDGGGDFFTDVPCGSSEYSLGLREGLYRVDFRHRAADRRELFGSWPVAAAISIAGDARLDVSVPLIETELEVQRAGSNIGAGCTADDERAGTLELRRDDEGFVSLEVPCSGRVTAQLLEGTYTASLKVEGPSPDPIRLQVSATDPAPTRVVNFPETTHRIHLRPLWNGAPIPTLGCAEKPFSAQLQLWNDLLGWKQVDLPCVGPTPEVIEVDLAPGTWTAYLRPSASLARRFAMGAPSYPMKGEVRVPQMQEATLELTTHSLAGELLLDGAPPTVTGTCHTAATLAFTPEAVTPRTPGPVPVSCGPERFEFFVTLPSGKTHVVFQPAPGAETNLPDTGGVVDQLELP